MSRKIMDSEYQIVSWDRVQEAVKGAEALLSELKTDYPKLSMYLVFSSRQGQVDIRSDLLGILKQLPSMVADQSDRSRAVALASDIDRLTRSKSALAGATGRKRRLLADIEKQIASTQEDMAALGPYLGFRDDMNVEIRFGNLKYDLIWKLKKDPRIDMEQTEQRKASIRVVLGSIRRFLD